MNSDQFLKILEKYRSGKAGKQDILFLKAYYRLFEGKNDMVSLLSAAEKEALGKEIKEGLMRKVTFHPQPTVRHLVRKWWAAASLILLSAAGVAIYLNQGEASMITYEGKRSVLRSYGNKAILLRPGGDRIDLGGAAPGQIASDGLMKIVKSKNGGIYFDASTLKAADTALNTVYTPKGGAVMVVLPDGSKAYLNAASSLSFPSTFYGKSRNVRLSGEVYFEVAPDKSRPFFVIGGGQTVQVLGTHFNVKAYTDEASVRTTLLEGRVTVATKDRSSHLKPGEQAVNHSGDLKISPLLNADDAVSWKNGMFHFEKANIKEVLREFARWYDVQIIYTGVVNERLFSGDIYKNLELGKALELLNYEEVHFTIKGRQILVNPQ